MPQSTNLNISKRYKDCNRQLSELLQSIGYVEDEKITGYIEIVTNYYSQSLKKANNSQKEDIVEEYESYITYLQQVKDGKLTAEKAEEEINTIISSRKIGIVFYNIAKVLEMLFWAFAATTCYSACILVGVPLIFTDFMIGMAVTIATAALMYKTFKFSLDCCKEFKSTERHEEARVAQNTLISFFKISEPESLDIDAEQLNDKANEPLVHNQEIVCHC